MKQVTILSGKGGVGKSSITASLAVVMSGKTKVLCVDCDVDASNLSLVLGLRKLSDSRKLSTNVEPVFDFKKCVSCKKCYEACHFDAISWVDDKPVLNDFGCEGCGVCMRVCPAGAIHEGEVFNAQIGSGNTKYGFDVISGQLEIGESGSGKIVHSIRELARKKDAEIVLNDAAAGIGCPVIASVVGSDYVLAVTEPTPSAFSDLRRALELVGHFRIRSGIIINKFDLNPELASEIEKFAKKKGLKVLAKIPFDKSFQDALINITPIVIYNPDFQKLFKEISDHVQNEISDNNG